MRAEIRVHVWVFALYGVLLTATACGDQGGGDDDVGDETGECPTPGVVDCEEVHEDSLDAAPIPGCFGADIGSPLNATPQNGQPFDLPGLVETSDPAVVGVWTAIVANEDQLPIHSIHRPTGRFLQFGGHGHGGDPEAEDKTVWFPPEPCTPGQNGIGDCEVVYDVDLASVGDQSHIHADLAVDLFCSGHVNIAPESQADLIYPVTLTVGGQDSGGGNNGIGEAYFFTENLADTFTGTLDWCDTSVDPTCEPWEFLDSLSDYRWYPTITVLSDKRVAAPGGLINTVVFCGDPNMPTSANEGGCRCDPNDPNDPYYERCEFNAFYDDYVCDPDLYDDDDCYQSVLPTPGLEILSKSQGVWGWTYYENAAVGLYPQMFVLPDLPIFQQSGSNLGGKYLYVGAEASPSTPSRFFDLTDPTLEPVEIGGPTCTRGSSAVMYEPGKIMKFGGGGQPSRITEVLDLTDECPTWRRVGETGMRRRYSTGVLLPDGNVLATGGTARSNSGDVDAEDTPTIDERFYTVFTTELFLPGEESWCRLADLPGTDDIPNSFPALRGYHSQSFLLRDGRVYLGSGGRSGGTDHYDYMLYAPPYLFWGDRPQVSLPNAFQDIGWMTTGDTFTLDRENGVTIDRVTLIKLSSSTHQWDMEQRFLELDIVSMDNDEVIVDAPPSTCYATPGYYMIFAISDEGVPSIGEYVALTGDCEAATEVAQASPPAPSNWLAINDRLGSGSTGLLASCGGEGSSLDLDAFGQSLVELCTAIGCPNSSSIAIEATLESTTGQAVSPSTVLDTATLGYSGGFVTVTDPLELNVSGTTFNSNIDLGPGEHVIELCGTVGLVTACTSQPLEIVPPVAGNGSTLPLVGAIEPRLVELDRLPLVDTWSLGDDDIATVPLPDEFNFVFNGSTVSTLYVGSNGGIRVSPGTIAASNGALTAGSSTPDIAPYWDDLDPSDGGRVQTYFDGRRLIVGWDTVTHASGGAVSFQVHLYSDGRIEFHYGSVDMTGGATSNGGSATVGIVAVTGPGLTISRDDDGLLSSARALAIGTGTCVASSMRLPNSIPCEDRPENTPRYVEICGASSPVDLTPPAMPTMCEANTGAFISGGVYSNDVRLPAEPDGRVVLYAGEYEARWNILTATDALNSVAYSETGDQASTTVHVSQVETTQVCCAPGQQVQVLTAQADTYVAGTGAFCVAAQGGNDIVSAGAGNDVLLGHAGNDQLTGGDGDDLMTGGDNDDDLSGGAGADEILGNSGNDAVGGGSGDDQLWGGEGSDVLNGSNNSDVLIGGPGADDIDGGAGDDHIVILDLCEVASGELLDGGDGSDTLWLPDGVTQGDLQTLGVTIQNIESVGLIAPQYLGESECL